MRFSSVLGLVVGAAGVIGPASGHLGREVHGFGLVVAGHVARIVTVEVTIWLERDPGGGEGGTPDGGSDT